LFHLVVRQRRARTINQINKPDHRQNVTEAPFVSTIFRFIDEDDSNGFTRTDLNNLGRDAVTRGKCESVILEENGSSDDSNDDFQDYFNDSSDKDISHDINTEMEYGEVQSHMSETTSLRSDHEKNYSHIEYVLQGIKEQLSDNNNEDYDNEDNL